MSASSTSTTTDVVANVVDLAAVRRARAPRCPCSTERTCYPHRLADLAARVRAEVAAVDQLLLVPSIQVQDLGALVLDVLDAITTECLPHEPAPEESAR